MEHALNEMGGVPVSYRVSFDKTKGVQLSGDEPTPLQRAALLHHLRPFLLKKEPFEFGKIRNIITNSTDTPVLRQRLDQMKELFGGGHLRKQMVISIGDLVVTSEAALDRWLNGFEYHRDSEKALELIQAHDPLPVDASRPIFRMMLREKANAILHLAQVVGKMLSDPEVARAPDTL